MGQHLWTELISKLEGYRVTDHHIEYFNPVFTQVYIFLNEKSTTTHVQ